jgi:hypothetical protein
VVNADRVTVELTFFDDKGESRDMVTLAKGAPVTPIAPVPPAANP